MPRAGWAARSPRRSPSARLASRSTSAESTTRALSPPKSRSSAPPRAASRPIAIISALPAPEALFLLGTHGLTAIADQVVATDLGQPPRSPLQRIAAAVERLGVASAELCSNAAADHEALDAYMSSRIARLSNFV
jgi:hypothetical protein